MKAINKIKILIAITIFCYSNISAQQNDYPVKGTYFTNNTMSAYNGTWRWVNGTDTVLLYLTTQKIYFNFNGGVYADCIVGWHLYKRGNAIIESNYDKINDVQFRSFDGSNGWRNDQPRDNYVSGNYKDLTKHKSEDLKLTLNAAQNQLTWKLENSEGMVRQNPGDPPFDYGFTVPKNMVLTKL